MASSSSVLLLCLVAALAAVATSQPLATPPDFKTSNAGAKNTVKIGCMLPLTGDNGVKGVAARNGIIMALNDLAAKNKDYNFVLTCVDTQCDPEKAKAAAATLKKAGVVGVIGDVCSKATLAAKDVLAPILLISPTSTSDKLTIAGDNFMRLSPPDRFQSRVLANMVKSSAGGAVPVGVAVEPTAYGQGLADGFAAAYKKLGGTVKFTVTMTPTNAVQAAQDMAKAGVTKVLLAMNNDTWAAQFLAAGAAIPGFSPMIFAGDAQFNPMLPTWTAGFGKTTLLDKLTVTAYNQGTAAFQAAYAKATKEPYTGHAAHSYDAVTVLVMGYMDDAKGGKPVAMASSVTPLKQAFTGVSGNVKFDATGDLIPGDTSYQSVTYKAGKPVVGAFLPLPAN